MKSKFNSFIALLSILLVSVSSCTTETPKPVPEKKGDIELNFKLYNGANEMAWNETVAIDGVDEYRMDFFKYYMSNIYAVKTDGSKQKLTDVLIVNTADADESKFTYSIKTGSYDKLEMGVGLDSILNASDPAMFNPEEPLSASQAMYWSWATKYRFVKIDARANENDTIGSPTDILVAYHPGADEFYRTTELVNPFEVRENGTVTFSIKLDLAAVFNGPAGVIDIPSEPQTHTTPDDYDLAEKFTDNFAAAFSPM